MLTKTLRIFLLWLCPNLLRKKILLLIFWSLLCSSVFKIVILRWICLFSGYYSWSIGFADSANSADYQFCPWDKAFVIHSVSQSENDNDCSLRNGRVGRWWGQSRRTCSNYDYGWTGGGCENEKENLTCLQWYQQQQWRDQGDANSSCKFDLLFDVLAEKES